ncbi:hypothetical protein KC19_11G155800 [Ceratodon purpureus]|uniref:Uncharacterized protein n=1 Tax=Ceratodon purpureus TaxID=3225 RepID=A0A8T0GED3_CERPU|nr:hypothetical protein KC19_11G155800 [Ceratodon purpureus]
MPREDLHTILLQVFEPNFLLAGVEISDSLKTLQLNIQSIPESDHLLNHHVSRSAFPVSTARNLDRMEAAREYK